MRRIARTEQAKAQLILNTVRRFAESGSGDLTALQGDVAELRLRVGDYRLFFVSTSDDVIEVRRVRHRREAYR